MRIALVFALAGAALVGCTKDYSGDISDLNKEVSAIQSTLTSLQTSIQGAQSAADAAAATANTALSAAKAAATADELNAVKTALAAAATSADLTAVDAKYAAYIPAIDAAAKASDLEALETAIKAAIAATDVKVADLEKAFEAYAKKADLDEAVKKLGELETNYIALEARVKALEDADAKIQELIDANKAGIEANAEAIEALQKLVEELTAQVDGAFSIKGVNPQGATVSYLWSEWNPGTTKAEKENFNKLAEKFPELKEIKKGDVIEYSTSVPFIVTPSTIEFDETDSFAFVDANGKDFGWELGEPFASPFNVKAGTAGVWLVKVLAPAYKENGDVRTGNGLALVVERANGAVAQTSFEYAVTSASYDKTAPLNISVNNKTYKPEDFENDAVKVDTIHVTNGNAIYGDCFVIEPTNVLQVEKYGVSVDGDEITILNRPAAGEDAIEVNFKITAIGMNGKTGNNTFKVTVAPETITANAELADQTVTLAYNAKATGHEYEVAVDYAVEDFGFSPLEWDMVFNALVEAQKTGNTLSAYFLEDADKDYNDVAELTSTAKVEFLKANKKDTTLSNSTLAKYIKFSVNSKTARPGEYTIKLTDGELFCGVGNVTVVNPEASPIKLAEALCDAEGVLQIVGTYEGGNIKYDLNNALVYKSAEATVVKFTDVAYKEAHDYDPNTNEKHWLADTAGTFQIQPEDGNNHQLYTPRTFEVKYKRFTNANNPCTFEFVAEAVSPIYDEAGKGGNITVTTTGADGKEAVFSTIYTVPGTGESKVANLDFAKFGGKYVAGNKKGTEFKIGYTGGQTKVTYEWKKLTDQKDKYFDYSKPTTVKLDTIEFTNVGGNREYVVNTENKLIKVDLDKALELGWITRAQYIKYNADLEHEFSYYLSMTNWTELYDIWASYWNVDAKYAGQYIPKGLNPIGENLPAETVQQAIDDKNEEINDLAKGDDADKLKKAKYDFFKGTLMGAAKLETKLTQICYEAKAPVDGEDSVLGPEEIKLPPYFTCADPGEYTKYVYFNGENVNQETITAQTPITKVIARANLAGKSTVEIPLTLNVVDNWGMTSKKEFKVTVKVKE